MPKNKPNVNTRDIEAVYTNETGVQYFDDRQHRPYRPFNEELGIFVIILSNLKVNLLEENARATG